MRRGVAWIFAGRAADQILGFLFGIVLARLLVPEDFGTLLTVQVFTGFVGFISGGGMGQALVRAKSVTKSDYDVVFTLQVLIGLAIYAGFFFVAPYFARWYDNPIYTDLLRVSALTFILRPFVNLSGSMLYRGMRYKTQSVIGLICIVLSSGISIAMAYHGFGVWSLVWGGIGGAIAHAVLQMYRSGWRPGFSFDFRLGRDLARYGFLVSANDLVDYARSRVGVFLLSRTLGPASVGLYNKAESLARMPHTFVTGSVYQVLFRSMAGEQDNLDKCRYLFQRSIMLVALYATPLYIGLLWLAEPLVRGLYGEKWIGSAVPLMLLALAWPAWLLTNLSGAVAAALNRLGAEIRIQIVTLLVTAAGIYLALPWGVTGVAWAIVAVAYFTAALMLRLACQALHVRWPALLRAVWPAALFNAILAGTLFVVARAWPAEATGADLLHVLSMSAIGAVVYASCVLTFPVADLAAERARWRSVILSALRR